MSPRKEETPLPAPPDIFGCHRLAPFMAEVRERHQLQRLADRIGLSSQSVRLALESEPQRVVTRLTAWKQALKLERPAGEYFELLAIIEAVPYARRPGRMVRRAHHLLGRLQTHGGPERPAVARVVYRADPLCPLLHAAVGLGDFPAVEAEIPVWLLARARGLKRFMPAGSAGRDRVRTAWRWLKRIGAVRYNQRRRRWERLMPDVLAPEPSADREDSVRNPLLRAAVHQALSEATEETVEGRLTVGEMALIPLPSAALPLLERMCAEFAADMVRLLGGAGGPETPETPVGARSRPASDRLREWCAARNLPPPPPAERSDALVGLLLTVRPLIEPD